MTDNYEKEIKEIKGLKKDLIRITKAVMNLQQENIYLKKEIKQLKFDINCMKK